MDPAEFRETGHALVETIGAYLEGVEGRALFPSIAPADLDRLFDEPLPREPLPAAELLREIDEKLLPYCAHVSHPGYFGLITPTPTPVGILGDFLASALNQNLGMWAIGPSAVAMERRTVRWLADLCGYGPRAGGNLTSGGTMANFIGLKLARDAVSGDRAQREGVRDRWAVYASEERHVSVDKAVDAVGVGRENLRVLPTDDRFEVRLDALEAAIAKDKADGVRPLCIVGIAGATNTGAVDALSRLREIADRERMWVHVDAAYGGGMLLSERRPGVLRGLELADSITIDPHKWFYAPLDAGAILVRDEARLTASFGMKPAYLADERREREERYLYYVHGFEQSRRFRSLKVWMSFKRYGAREIGRWIDGNVDLAERLHALCEASRDFRSAVLPRMSAVCVRYAPEGLAEPDAARLHREVAARIEQQGRFWFATTEMKGRTWFRICPVNFRTRPEHIDDLFATLTEECARSLEGGVRSVRTPRRSGDSPGSPPTRTDRTRND
jgi:glutamate/tyrosine decarboxylase-like PLP-dependent enzyme